MTPGASARSAEQSADRVPAARLDSVVKTYGPVQVLGVEELTLYRGQIVGLLGENGAGKSTMMGVLSGTKPATSGRVEVDGVELPNGDPMAAAAHGVAMVSQEFPLVGQLTVAENIFLGRVPEGAGRFVIDRRRTIRQAQDLMDELGLDIDVRQQLGSLSVAQRQLVEVAKAWQRKPLLLILDEPTSALGSVEADLVLDLARRHAANGGCVLFIGHRMDEVLELCDRLVVLRNGRLVADLPREGATEAEIVRHMVGAELAEQTGIAPPTGTEVVLRTRELTAEGLGPVDLTVRAGEVVGVAGLMGSGRSRLLHTIYGAQPATGGEMELMGARHAPRSAQDGVAAGVMLVAEDRKQQSLLPDASIRWNTTLAALPALSRRGVLTPRRDRSVAERMMKTTRVRCRSMEQPIRELSGGNQQRAVFGRALAVEPKLLLLDEPTRGVDVGAKAEIYQLIAEAAGQGAAVLVASSELEELLRICHRIVVMAGGVPVVAYDRSEFDKHAIITHAAAVSAGVKE